MLTTKKTINMDQLTESWHSKSEEDIFKSLHASIDGLQAEDICQRFVKFGANRIAETKSRGLLERFFSQFHNVLIYVLIVAAVVTAMLQHWLDAGVIISVVMINAIIGVVQEGKAENALRAIRKMLSLNAMVMRGGRQLRVPGRYCSSQFR